MVYWLSQPFDIAPISFPQRAKKQRVELDCRMKPSEIERISQKEACVRASGPNERESR